MSFLKYLNDDHGGKLSYSRVEQDGIPWRGPRAMLKEEEFEQLSEEVNDGHVGVFDLSKAEDLAKLEEIVDKTANGWWRISAMKEQFVVTPSGDYKVVVYCVWVEPHKQLAIHKLPAGMLGNRTGGPSYGPTAPRS